MKLGHSLFLLIFIPLVFFTIYEIYTYNKVIDKLDAIQENCVGIEPNYFEINRIRNEIIQAGREGMMNFYNLSATLFIMILLITFFLNAHITRPIKDLSKAVDELSKGNFETKINTETGINEIDVLAQSLNRILASLKLAVKAKEKKR